VDDTVLGHDIGQNHLVARHQQLAVRRLVDLDQCAVLGLVAQQEIESKV
jgi:hypothetical protein